MAKLLAWLLVAASGPLAFAEGLSRPLAGCIIDQTNTLRPVFGISANFVLGNARATDALSAACSGTRALVKTADSLAWLDAEPSGDLRFSAPPGRALFALFEETAVVYFPATSEWFQASAGGLVPLLLEFGAPFEQVLAIAKPDPDRILVAVRRQDALWRLTLRDGRVESETELPGASMPLLLLRDGSAVFAAESGLILETPNGARTPIPLAAQPASLAQMGDDWIAVTLGGERGQVAVRVSGGRPETFRLPEAGP